jgi:5-methylthioadenosine/S-adenosylhomocysteine deaminase
MGILIKDSLVVTPDNYFFGFIEIEEGKIKKIGKGKTNLRDDIEIKNRVVTPGFVNLHTHSPMVLFRGIAEDAELEEWLTRIIMPLEEKLTAKDVYIASKFAIVEMLKSGTIFFNDMYAFPEATAKAMKEIGIKGVVSTVVRDKREKISKAIKLAKKLRNEKGIKVAIAPHSEYSCPPEILKEIAEVSKENNMLVHFHYGESKKLLKKVKKELGNPLKLYSSFGLLNERLILAHGVHLTKEELFLLQRKKVNVAHNPSSNMKLSDGIAKVSLMKRIGLNVGIGTDGAASNNSLDILREAKQAILLQKLLYGAKSINAKDVFQMLTREGAKAIGFENEIRENASANLVLFKPTEQMLPLYDPYSSIIYSASSKDVNEVIIDGKLVVRNKKIKGEQRIKKDFEKVAKRFAPVAQW